MDFIVGKFTINQMMRAVYVLSTCGHGHRFLIRSDDHCIELSELAVGCLRNAGVTS